MLLPFKIEDLKKRLVPTREEAVLVVLSFDLAEDVEEDFAGVTDFIVNRIGFSTEDLPNNTFVKIVLANRASSERLVEYYHSKLRDYLDQNSLKGSVFIFCGERWASNIPIIP